MDSRRRYLIANAIKGGGILPSGYKECEYIESTGTQYIDTGIVLSQFNKFEIEFNGDINIQSNEQPIVSNNRTGATQNFVVGSYQGYLYAYSRTETNVKTSTFSRGWNSLAVKWTYDNINHTRTINVNGSNYQGTLTNNVSNNNSITIFASFGYSVMYSLFKIKTLKLLIDDIIIADFIPCLDNNNVPCMYDTISKQTFYNAGTGTFLYQLKS